MTNFQRRVEYPPPTGNQALDQWLQGIATAFNNMPRFSWFSGTTPNSILTGTPGDIAINLASGSTVTRAWIMGGNPTSIVTRFGWVTLQTGPA